MSPNKFLFHAFLLIAGTAAANAAPKKAANQPVLSPLDEYVQAARSRSQGTQTSPGSLYSTTGRFADLARDLRASQIDDLVTVVISDKASALSRGATNSSRKSNASASIVSAAAPLKAAAPLANLITTNGSQKLDGQGETTRETQLTTTVSARVVEVLPNGNLILEGTKDVQVNSERQRVTIRGVARWNDLNSGNQIGSDRLAQLQVWIDGKGVVNDAIRRPNFLYRLILGILPF
jgi:flagellar L-ring protein FlgH